QLNSQNCSFFGSIEMWFWRYVFPLLFPSQTSKPASANMNAAEFSGRFAIQLVESHSSPCCMSTTGLHSPSGPGPDHRYF
ncbi:hypothetical protein PMAYCL1PPCAC_32943, partial [Pristionchus mayeri]